MNESQIFQPSLPYFHMNMNSILENVRDDGFCMDDITCYTLSTILMDENSRSLFSSQDTHDTIFLQDRFPVLDHLDDHEDDMDISTDDVLIYFKDPVSNVVEISTTDVSMSLISSDTSLDVTSMPVPEPVPMPSSLVLPSEGMEVDNELTVFHLLMAYAEAMELGQEELAEVVAERISEKVSPVGDTVERLMYYMFQTSEKQSDYLKQESMKNFYQAFKAFYQIFPHGKFAHFVANLVILESLPKDVDIIRIFDFDIGEGIQWASLIEAIGHNHGQLEVRLTSVKFISDEEEEEHSHNASPSTIWKFEDTKKRLCDYARSYGLKLKVDEMEWDDDLAGEIKNINQQPASSSYGSREFFVFNCMVGLPHMGRVRSRKNVFDFLKFSQTFLKSHGRNCAGSHSQNQNGIITFGDGDAWEKVRNASNYTSFLDGNMTHYQTLLESIKINFPSHLGEARAALECLFVAPFVSSSAWAERWEERNKYGHFESRFGLEGLNLSRESIVEAKEVVREGESLYGVRIDGESHNEMVMEWRGIPMVKVSCWRS